MKLTHTFFQYKDKENTVLESDLSIEVEYDPTTATITEVLRVWSWSYKWRTGTDVTKIFSEQLDMELEDILQRVDWWELYTTKKNERKVYA